MIWILKIFGDQIEKEKKILPIRVKLTFKRIDLSEKSNRVGIAFYRVGVGVLGSWGKTKKQDFLDF